MLFCSPAEEPVQALEADIHDNLCGVLACFYANCNTEGFLNNPTVSVYLEVCVAKELCMFCEGPLASKCMHKNLQISNHEDPLSGQHRGNGVVEFIEAVEDPEWQAVIGPELHPHVYEFMPQRYGTS